MISKYFALAALTDRVRFEDLARVAAALQIQVLRDFTPHWNARAIVTATTPEAIPAGHCPIFIHDGLQATGASGFHRTRADDSPYVLIPYGINWSLAAGHELLRLLADPSGSERVPGPSCLPGQGMVEYLLDVCAPCQDVASAYLIESVIVPDFCMPTFFDNQSLALPSVCSFTGMPLQPFRPAPGGAVTWLADDGLLYHARGHAEREPRVYGGYALSDRGKLLMRELVDQRMPHRLTHLANAFMPDSLRETDRNASRARLTNLMRFREDITTRYGIAAVREQEPADEAIVDEHDRRGRVYPPVRLLQFDARGEERTTSRTAS